ncbi:energy transducer TonB [Edaphobacter albus]|uniref:energy transducer TonB n=1 Tax=Edaphobacter sp. 4G125 TaxID=2763071 RepID=UPI00164704CB|nr:energy transducer TonB [Edaphobacter sp. 4G125]QNI37452.1 energy transducer TonB [Edaphobacter sp. 4G125]
MPRAAFVWVILLSSSTFLSPQTPANPNQKFVSIPLADVLPKALARSSLTAPKAEPFHIKLKVRDVLDENSFRQAEIEEYWLSPTLWKRIVTAPNLRQVTTHNASGLHYETTGDYFPQWLSMFVTAIEDPVPANRWAQPGLHLQQRELSPGVPPVACAAVNIHLTETAAPFATLCFSNTKDVLLPTITGPDYQMKFNNYQRFGDKFVPHLYISRLLNTLLVGNIELLEPAKEKEDFFATPASAVDVNPLASFTIAATTVQKMAKPHGEIAWPSVPKGKTSGNITLLVSVDNLGETKEVSVLNSDNARLNEFAREQVLHFLWITAKTKAGDPIQISGPYTLPFQTTIKNQPENLAAVSLSTDELRRHVLSQIKPIYPASATVQHLSGMVYLYAKIATDGSVSRVVVIESSNPSFTKPALDAVKQWKYQPYLLDGIPVEVNTMITVVFNAAGGF